jgi:hypothetical protein
MASHHRSLEDEGTPLLGGKSRTPLPWGQITLIFVALIAEPISSVYILPFINQVCQQLFLCVQYLTLSDARSVSNFFKQLIGELGITGGDDRKIGYYAGLIVGANTFTQMVPYSTLSRNPSFSSRRHSRHGSGAGYLILSVADLSFYLVCLVSVCPTLPLAYRGPWVRSSSG